MRRGPDWSWGDQDGNPPTTGTVVSFQPANAGAATLASLGPSGMSFGGFGMPYVGGRNNVVVQWQSGLQASYVYDKSIPKFDLQRANPADPTAVPAGQASIAAATKLPPNEFKVGDKVRLSQKPKKARTGDTEECLGAYGENRLGVIVKEEKKLKGAIGASKATAPDLVVTVAGLLNGVLCEYHSSDLGFADGSSRGNVPRSTGKHHAGVSDTDVSECFHCLFGIKIVSTTLL